MKKTLSFFLSMVLLISISFSALAADSAATDLEKITAAVKTKLSIDDKYNNFNGDLNDYGMSKSYNLFWSGENRNLSVQVSETGKILNYSRSEENDYSSDYNSLRESNIPKFPSTESAEKAKKLAQDFLKKVLEQNESCDIALEENIFRDVNFYSFSNTLKINSVKTPISVSVTVNLKGGFVSSFFRSDAYDKYLGTPPSPTNLTDKTAALQKLKEKTAINLVYARDYQSGTQTKTALLRYVPSFSWNLCVDAKTGSLVDMNEVYEEVNRNGATENAKATSDAGMGGSEPQNSLALTEYEKKLIENLKTVLSKEKLDQIARNVPEFGLSSDYKVSYSSYFKPDDQKEDISFSINYSKQQKNDAGYTYFLEKNVTLDAKTGEILSFNTYSSENSKATNKLTSAEAKKKAEAFLKKYSAKELQDSMEYNGDIFLTQESSYAPFCFARKVNDIPFPENSLNISIDRTTGDISYYYKNKWEDGITFEAPKDIKTPTQALNKFVELQEVTLSYINYPKALDPTNPLMKSYIELGYGYINELKLFYSYNSDNYIPSLDAKTLKNTYSPVSSQNSLSYTDITNHWAKKQITSLATYGIGFKGESFKPNGKLTQKDFLTLLVKALGDNYLDETVKENESIIYSSAYANGILTPSEKNPSKVLTRVETIKYLLNATSYKFAAKYPELFTLSFKDANKIPAADKGYVALASALKIITGDQNNKINPLDTATRAQGAVMIYNFMNRK